MNPLLILMALPFLAAMLIGCLPQTARGVKTFLAFLGVLGYSGAAIWVGQDMTAVYRLNNVLLFQLMPLSRMALWTSAVIAPLIFWAAWRETHHMSGWGILLLALAAGALILLTDHWVLLIIGWGILGLALYLLIPQGCPKSSEAARKTLYMVGGTDALLIAGLMLLVNPVNNPSISDFALKLNGFWPWTGFAMVLIAIMAKAGAMPFHTWLPDMARRSPGSVSALVPATMDKLVAIYFLARISYSAAPMPLALQALLLVLAVISLLGGVLMALVQHDMRRLLAYHAVSQTGYMILALATGSKLGLMAAFFHLINNVLYKSGLFLAAGVVENGAGHTDLDKLGGLSVKMPLCFASFMVMALAISGVPPLNGFFSKWMIIQALGQAFHGHHIMATTAILVAMVGSGLTLASFLKLSYAVYLGQGDASIQEKLSGWKSGGRWMPLAVISLLCIVLGITGLSWMTGQTPEGGEALQGVGLWLPLRGILYLAGGGLFALIILALFKGLKPRRVPLFFGGETLNPAERILGSGFYHEIELLPVLRNFYDMAHNKLLDVYELGIRWGGQCFGPLRAIHSGVLNRYAAWLILGWVALIVVFLGVWQ